MRIVEICSTDPEVIDEGEPSLVAAVRHVPTGQIYRGQPGQAHWDVAKDNGLAGVDWKHQPEVETGFVNHKGHFLSRARALDYATRHDMLHPMALRYLSTPDAPAELGASFLKRH